MFSHLECTVVFIFKRFHMHASLVLNGRPSATYFLLRITEEQTKPISSQISVYQQNVTETSVLKSYFLSWYRLLLLYHSCMQQFTNIVLPPKFCQSHLYAYSQNSFTEKAAVPHFMEVFIFIRRLGNLCCLQIQR